MKQNQQSDNKFSAITAKNALEAFLKGLALGVILEFERQVIVTQLWLNAGCPDFLYPRGWDLTFTIIISIIFGLFLIGLPLGICWGALSLLSRTSIRFFKLFLAGVLLMMICSLTHDYLFMQKQGRLIDSVFGIMLPEPAVVVGLVIYSLLHLRKSSKQVVT